ncbi:MAG: hypothetical protein ACF8R7_05005 [Phycisphaerales bacterium JB039]
MSVRIALPRLARRRVTLAAVVVAASLWAGGLGVTGLWLVFSAAGKWSMFGLPLTLGGLTAIVMGQFVFSYLVADRLFPGAARVIGWRIEIWSVALFLAGCAATVWAALGAR